MGCIYSNFLEKDFLKKSPSKIKLFHHKQPLDLVYDDFTDEEYYSLNTHYRYYDKKVVYV
jgi:hypothetical protein